MFSESESSAGGVADRPMVSICIPTYNQVEFLPAAVESALAQDFPALEVVISENLSTDGTAAYLAGLRDPRLRIVTPQRHLTMSDNWRFCVDQSRGHYFAILSSDDILLPGFAKKLAAALEAHPDAAFVYCALQTINEHGDLIGVVRHVGGGFFRQGKEDVKRFLVGPGAPLPGILFVRKAYDAVGGFRSWSMLGDWDVLLRLLQFGGVAYDDEILAQYRRWSNAERDNRFLTHIEESCRIYEETMVDVVQRWPKLAGAVLRARSTKARSFAIAAGSRPKSEFRDAARLVRKIDNSARVRTLLWLSGIRWPVPLMRASLWAESALRQTIKKLLYAS